MTKSVATRVYGVIVRLYPPSFRRRFGDEMAKTFADHHADVRATGDESAFRFWLALLADEAAGIVRQHGAVVAARVRPPRPTVPGIAVAVLLFPPLFVTLLLATVNLAVAVPHPPMAGLAVLLGMGVLVAVPALVAALASYFLGSAMASGFARLRRQRG